MRKVVIHRKGGHDRLCIEEAPDPVPRADEVLIDVAAAGVNLSYLFERREMLTAAMTQLLGWCADGRVRPPPIQPFPLERVADAHRALESATTVGKLVLLP